MTKTTIGFSPGGDTFLAPLFIHDPSDLLGTSDSHSSSGAVGTWLTSRDPGNLPVDAEFLFDLGEARETRAMHNSFLSETLLLSSSPSSTTDERLTNEDTAPEYYYISPTRSSANSSYLPKIWTTEVIFRVATISVVMILTLVGNVALIAVITCHASLRRKRVSIFLLNLAVGDLMVCLFTMTSEILFVAFGEWVLGAVACKVIVYGQIVTLASTTFLLTAMSIDRYQVLVQPLQPLRGPPYVWVRMAAAWLLALFFATPQLFIFVETTETREDGHTILTCKSVGYTAEWQRKVYFSFMTAYILVIPTAIMSFCYSSIIRVVWMRTGGRLDIDAPKIHFVTSRPRSPAILNGYGGREGGGGGSGNTVPHPNSLRTSIDVDYNNTAPPSLRGNNQFLRPQPLLQRRHYHNGDVINPGNVLRGGAGTGMVGLVPRSTLVSIPRKVAVSSKRNVVKMTMTVIVGFVVCWTPYFVVSLVRIYSDYRIQISHALSISEIMALVHSALNPLLYMLFSTRTVKSLCSVHSNCHCCPLRGATGAARRRNSNCFTHDPPEGGPGGQGPPCGAPLPGINGRRRSPESSTATPDNHRCCPVGSGGGGGRGGTGGGSTGGLGGGSSGSHHRNGGVSYGCSKAPAVGGNSRESRSSSGYRRGREGTGGSRRPEVSGGGSRGGGGGGGGGSISNNISQGYSSVAGERVPGGTGSRSSRSGALITAGVPGGIPAGIGQVRRSPAVSSTELIERTDIYN